MRWAGVAAAVIAGTVDVLYLGYVIRRAPAIHNSCAFHS